MRPPPLLAGLGFDKWCGLVWVNVRTQFVARDAGDSLQFENALGWDAITQPFVNSLGRHIAGFGNRREAAFSEDFLKSAHATFNHKLN